MTVISKAKHAFDWFLLEDAVFDRMAWFSAAIASRVPHSFFLLETIKVSHIFSLSFLIFFLGLHDIRIPVFPPSFFFETFDPLLKIQITDIEDASLTLDSIRVKLMQILSPPASSHFTLHNIQTVITIIILARLAIFRKCFGELSDYIQRCTLLSSFPLPSPLDSAAAHRTSATTPPQHTQYYTEYATHDSKSIQKCHFVADFYQQGGWLGKIRRVNMGYISLNLRLTVINMSDLQCPKCASCWTQENPPKKLINCHHNLCLRCLKDQLVCPIDKSRIEKRKYTLEAFLTNTDLLESAMLSKMAKPREKSKGHTRSQSSSNNNSAKCAKEFTTPLMDKYPVIEDKRSMMREKQTVVEVQLPYLSPEKGNQTSSKLTISPKRVKLSFDTCLLHSKKADLICLEDKCLICANCGLFGEHKQHKIIPYDEFLNQYSKITEESFKIYELLKQRQDKLDHDLLEAKIDEILKEKRDAEVKHIKTNTTAYIDFIKRLQRQLILDLDVAYAYKRKKLQNYDHIQEMINKREQFIASIQTMSNGVDDIFNLQNIGQYINYIDKESPHSFIINQGEYLLLEIDNYYKQKMQMIEDETKDVTYDFSLNLDTLKDSVNLISKDFKEISALIEENKKKVVPKTNPYTNKHQTPSRTPVTNSVNNSQSIKNIQKSPTVKVNNEEDQLLIGTNSKSNSKGSQQKIKKEVSPIQPACTFDDDHALIKPYEGDTDNFLKFSQVECTVSPAMLPRHPSLASNQGTRSKKIFDNNRENNLSNSRANRSRSKYGTAQRQSMVNVLGQKSQNKKKRKLDLPDKYLRIYQDLQKDKLQVLDLGGAFLGEPNILIISELFTSRCKLRMVKLMNNKLTDESFPEIISRCRFIASINLSYNLITEKSLEWLEQCCDNLGELKNITLSNNKIVLRNVRERLDGLARRGVKVSL